MEGKIIMGLVFILSAITSQAQTDNTFVPFDITQKENSFALPELQVDSIFIENLNTVLFDKNDPYMNIRTSNPNNKWRHFRIQFEKKDSLNYCIEVSLWDIPAEYAVGFFKYNDFFYWFDSAAPIGIILAFRQNKQFSYKEPLPGPYDPPFWYLTYNIETGNIEIKEEYCHWN